MDNLEDEIATATPDLEVEVNTLEHSPLRTVPRTENLDDSVEILEQTIDTVDLLSPQPSTSNSGGGAAAVTPGPVALIKTNLEEAFKDVAAADSLASATLDQNPSTSTSAAAAAAAGTSTASATSNVLECPICLQTCIHPARLPCGHIFCFLCVKGVAYKNRRCAMCRREIPPEFLDHPQLVNGIEDICTTKATDDGYQWFYEGRNGWWQYDDRTSQDLEEAFKKGERSCTILVAGYVYIVDFDAMIQQRQNEPARCRRVKRDLATIPKKGVAGLRIEGNTVTTDSNFAAQVYQRHQNRYRNNELMSGGDFDNSDNPILLRSSVDPPPPPNHRLRLSYGSLGAYVIDLGNPSEFVSTAAATDAALRIASDIIGSTLAHADELTRSGSNNTASTSSSSMSAYNPQYQGINNSDNLLHTSSGELSLNDLILQSHFPTAPITASSSTNTEGIETTAATTGVGGGGQQSLNTGNSVNLSRERGSRELLGAAEDLLGATQRVIATADQPTIDLFEQTLNDFHALTLRNIVDSSDEDDGDNDGDGDTDNHRDEHHPRQLLQHQHHSPPPPPAPPTTGQRSSHSNNHENP